MRPEIQSSLIGTRASWATGHTAFAGAVIGDMLIPVNTVQLTGTRELKTGCILLMVVLCDTFLKRPHGGYGNHVWSWQGGKIRAESDCWGEKQSGHSGSLREVPRSWSSGLEGVIITSIQAPSGLSLAISTVWPLRFHQGLTLHRQFILPLRRRVVFMTEKQVPKEICKEGCLEGLKYRQDELGARLGAVKSSS